MEPQSDKGQHDKAACKKKGSNPVADARWGRRGHVHPHPPPPPPDNKKGINKINNRASAWELCYVEVKWPLTGEGHSGAKSQIICCRSGSLQISDHRVEFTQVTFYLIRRTGEWTVSSKWTHCWRCGLADKAATCARRLRANLRNLQAFVDWTDNGQSSLCFTREVRPWRYK